MQIPRYTAFVKRGAIAIAIAIVIVVPSFISRLGAQGALPVTLDDVSILPPAAGVGAGGPGLVALTFTDHGSIAAKRVVLDVLNESGSLVARIDDYGKFSPGVAISHRFYLPEVGSTPQRVQIDSVTLADGTVVENQPRRPMPQMQQPVGYQVQMVPKT